MDFISFTVQIKPNKQEKEWLDKQLHFQFEVWNWLVRNYNATISDCITNKKKWPTNKILEKTIKEYFHSEVVQDWCGYRIYRGAVIKYVEAWTRVCKVKGTKQPVVKEWNPNQQSARLPQLEMKIHEGGIRLHTSNKIHWTKKRLIPLKHYSYCVDFYNNYSCTLKEYTILFRNGKYSLNLCLELGRPRELEVSGDGVLGLDWGIVNFLTDNQGNAYNYPESIRKLGLRISRLHSKLDKKDKGSNNFIRLSKKINRLYLKQSRIKKDWVEKLTTKFLRENKLICIEKIDLKQIRWKNKHKRKMLNQMQLFPFYLFRNRLIEKSKHFQCVVVEVDQIKYPTSQTCCICGKQEFRPLKQRTVQCECGNNIDRDVNAAINLIKFGQLELARACGPHVHENVKKD